MGMGFAPTWLRQVSPHPASQNHFNHCPALVNRVVEIGEHLKFSGKVPVPI